MMHKPAKPSHAILAPLDQGKDLAQCKTQLSYDNPMFLASASGSSNLQELPKGRHSHLRCHPNSETVGTRLVGSGGAHGVSKLPFRHPRHQQVLHRVRYGSRSALPLVRQT
jgi:hypothetical protein